MFRYFAWKARLRLGPVVCFLIGHDIAFGAWRMGEQDWCRRCFSNSALRDLEDDITMPKILNRWYIWMVERDWSWFNRFDSWLRRYSKHLPSWWEY